VEVKSRWKEYIEELYCASEKPKFDEMGIEAEGSIEEDNKGPDLLGDEIRAAIKEIKKGKAVGVDETPADFLKIMGEEAYLYLERICKKMYETGTWPEDFTKVVMVPLQKKQNATESADHRTISLISHASKILLHILTKRWKVRSTITWARHSLDSGKAVGPEMLLE